MIVHFGDNPLKIGVKVISEKMENGDCEISPFPAKELQRCGIAEISLCSIDVLRAVKKPVKPKTNLAIVGACALAPSFFEIYLSLILSCRK